MDKSKKPALNSCCDKERCVTLAGQEKAKLFRGSVCCFGVFTHFNGFGNVKRPILIVVKLFYLSIHA